MRKTRTLEIDMTLPEFGSTKQIPFTESDLDTFSRQYSEMVLRTYEYTSVEQEMEDWSLQDGYLVFAPEVGTIRIARGTVDDETAWWVDIKDWARPCHGSAVPKWEYQAHFPGIFTVDWVGWIYAQWIV